MILITGAAGFIGFHTSLRLLKEGSEVHGIDNLNDYYDPGLKKKRLLILESHPRFKLSQLDIADPVALDGVFKSQRPSQVLHLAAQAGVRYSLVNPRAYLDSNLTGFLNVLEGCRHGRVEHLVYASSSSVYGLDASLPFSVHQEVDHPVSFYGATKRANELMAHSYSHLFGIPTTALRYFTVYGPWGRPDMALFAFTRAILEGREIQIFGDGSMSRDFTYIDDAVEGTCRLLNRPAAPNPSWNGTQPDPATSLAPFRIYNIGNRSPVRVIQMIEILEKSLGLKAVKKFLPSQACEVQATTADVADLERDTGFAPATSLEVGVAKFVAWYREYHKS